jgi:hypothetical protein
VISAIGRERPCCRRAAKKREEIASFHCSVPPVPERKEWHTLGTVALRDFDPANDR